MRPRGVEDTGRPDWIRSEPKKVAAILRLRMVVDDEAARGHGHCPHFCVRRQKQLAPDAIDVEHADHQVGRINGARYLRASVAAGQQ
jgi:hypothetical protein